LNYHFRAGGDLVDEPPYDVSDHTKNKLYLTLAFMYLIVCVLIVGQPIIYSDSNSQSHEISHNVTLWAEPENYSYCVDIWFYSNHQDALVGYEYLDFAHFPVRPESPNMMDDDLFDLPRALDRFWVRIELCQPLVDDECVYSLRILEIGEPLSFYLGNHNLTILVIRAPTE